MFNIGSVGSGSGSLKAPSKDNEGALKILGQYRDSDSKSNLIIRKGLSVFSVGLLETPKSIGITQIKRDGKSIDLDESLEKGFKAFTADPSSKSINDFIELLPMDEVPPFSATSFSAPPTAMRDRALRARLNINAEQGSSEGQLLQVMGGADHILRRRSDIPRGEFKFTQYAYSIPPEKREEAIKLMSVNLFAMPKNEIVSLTQSLDALAKGSSDSSST